MLVRLLLGDCMERMAAMAENSVGVVVCDPPYGLEFMGKDWDAPWKYTINSHGFTDGADRIAAPSFTSSRNPTCQKCGKRKRTWDGGPPACACEAPEFDDMAHRISDMQAFQLCGVHGVSSTVPPASASYSARSRISTSSWSGSATIAEPVA